MKILAEPAVCEGLGMCEAMAHEFFEVGDDGVVNVLDNTPDEQHRELVEAAVAACPVAALRLHG
jgi:ferredoxin